MAFSDYLPSALKRAKGASNLPDAVKDQKIIADPKADPKEKEAAIARAKQRMSDRYKK